MAAGDRIQDRLTASADAQVKPEVGVKASGAPQGDPILSDSARGFVYSLRVYGFVDSSAEGSPRPGNGRDSTTFRWPHSPVNPAVLGFHRLRAFDNGVVERSAYDDDGDGLLSEAPASKQVLLRRVWLVTHGDSLWKSVVLTQHGPTTHFDSLGAGDAQSWTDTAFVGGQVAWWRKVYDGDGDGFAAMAATGAKTKIRIDNYSILGDGTVRYGFETHGPGPDGDYGRNADNERYAASAMTVNSKGEDVSKTESGDADGDGLLWSPAPGAANRVWETAAYFRRSDMKSYKDSLVKVLGTGEDADARVVHYGATYERMDGTTASVSVGALDGKTAFGPEDTVLVSERIIHAAGDEDRRDSTVRTAHMIPGRLDAEEDDKLLSSAVKVYFNAGSPVLQRSETFASAAPMAPGTDAKAGSLVVEEKRRGDGRNDFDRNAGAAAWREIRNAKGGDSTVTSGAKSAAGAGTYVSHAGKGLKQTGWYDPATGAFRDTVVWVDTKGAGIGKRTGAGSLKDGAGEYAATVVRADGKTSEVRVVVSPGSDGSRKLTRMAGKDTSVIVVRGDSVTQEKAFGKARVTFNLVRLGAGTYQLALAGEDGEGTALLRGEVTFGPEGSGTGDLVEYAKGKAKPVVSFLSEPDGAVLVGGVKLP